MKCAWQAYLKVLPQWMRGQVDKLSKDTLQELRLRISRPPELITADGSAFLQQCVTNDDLSYCMNAASQYSPWTASTIASGFITAGGGHRIGICGDAVITNGKITMISNVTSLCIRVARDLPGVAAGALGMLGSILIVGSPGRGKTTLLRDLIRLKSNSGQGAVAVVDERRELFPVVEGTFCFSPGARTEVLCGSSKADGIEMVIRTMNPRWVAVDEITAMEDCQAMVHASGCGVSMLATAHADNLQDFMTRPVYKPLVEHGVFHNIIVMHPDKSWSLERMNI